MAQQEGKVRGIGPHSRPDSLAKLDGRTKEAIRLREIRSDLIHHVGGNPSSAERMLIERAAWLLFHMEIMDRAAVSDGIMSERNGREYLAWANSARRMLTALGLKSAAAKPQTLAELLRQDRAA